MDVDYRARYIVLHLYSASKFKLGNHCEYYCSETFFIQINSKQRKFVISDYNRIVPKAEYVCLRQRYNNLEKNDVQCMKEYWPVSLYNYHGVDIHT